MDVPDRPDREDLLGQLIRVDAERDHDGQHDCRRDLAEQRAEKGSEHATEIASCRKPEQWADGRIRFSTGANSMLMMTRRPIRTLRGWAISVLQEAGAIRECEEHGWMQDRADPHARERAFDIARQGPPPGVSPDAAVAEVREVLDSIGDLCPECPTLGA